jgi:succinate dehydrogenase/fumarate reductase flavoprotein subunit
MILVHPDYNLSPREFAKINVDTASGIADEDICYEFAKDTFDRILDLETFGLKVRDDKGDFYFVPAVDVCPGHRVRIWTPVPGAWHELSPILAKKVASHPNISVLNRTSAIGLLTAGGIPGAPAVGAVGLGTRTGRFVVCEAKAVILASGDSNRLQRTYDTLYSPARFIMCGPPTNCGEGGDMAYRVGADIINMEFGCTTWTWKDFVHDGSPQAALLGRHMTGIGGVFTKESGSRFDLFLGTMRGAYNTRGPLYMDTSTTQGWPEEEGEMERILWTLDGEGTSAGYFEWMKARGEDFRKGPVEVEWRPMLGAHNNQPGVHIDANGRSNIEGLYCPGDLGAGGWRQSSQGGFVFGARAGAAAAEYVRNVPQGRINYGQVDEEKSRILGPLTVSPQSGYSWLELEDKARQIATDYGPPLTNDPKLERGLMHLERIKEKYLPRLYARNPREMMRASEVRAVYTMVEAFLRSALFRKESRQNSCTIFYKTDYPEQDDRNWLKHTVIRNVDGKMELSKGDVKRLNNTD